MSAEQPEGNPVAEVQNQLEAQDAGAVQAEASQPPAEGDAEDAAPDTNAVDPVPEEGLDPLPEGDAPEAQASQGELAGNPSQAAVGAEQIEVGDEAAQEAPQDLGGVEAQPSQGAIDGVEGEPSGGALGEEPSAGAVEGEPSASAVGGEPSAGAVGGEGEAPLAAEDPAPEYGVDDGVLVEPSGTNPVSTDGAEPGAPLDPNAVPEEGAEDPNAFNPDGYQAGAFDPNMQNEDPNAYQQADPNAYDPNAHDPNAYGQPDPNAYGQPDPNAYDPNAYGQPDPNAYDPNAYGQPDPNAYERADPNSYGQADGNAEGAGVANEAADGNGDGYGAGDAAAAYASPDYDPNAPASDDPQQYRGMPGEMHSAMDAGRPISSHHDNMDGGYGGGRPADVEALLAEEREKHEAQLKVETAAREELEDMILRIEKHFKAEQAARKKAEELLQQAIGTELDSKNALEDVLKKRMQEQKLLEEERHAIKRERQALENMRLEFEAELQAARAEVAKAQDALVGSEERIRHAEQVERARLEAEYQAKLMSVNAEMESLREEMAYRTIVMNDEMESWRQLGQITANAVMEAKGEVLDRKKELDLTKEKMDKMLDKLLVGRERGIELSGAISNNQRLLSFMPGGGLGSFNGGMGGGMGMPGNVMGGKMGPPGLKLPPLVKSDMPPGMGMPGMGMPGMGMPGMGMPGMPPPGMGIPYPMGNEMMGQMGYPHGGQDGQTYNQQRRASASDAQDPGSRDPPRRSTSARSESVSPPRGGGGGGGQYDHVRSRFRQDAEEQSMEAKEAAKARQRTARAKAKKPDRFQEADREKSRVAAMANRWN